MFRLFAELDDAKFGLFVVTVQVMSLQFALAIFSVTVWLAALKELLVKKQLSFTPGTPAPPAPPSVNDQRFTSLQFPLPPTQ